jgi:acetyl esterase/lipase
MLLFLALVSAFLAQLNYRRAPEPRPWWILTLLTTEFGHLLALLPLGVALLAWQQEAGQVRVTILVLCGVALAGLLRPSVSAWWFARGLPARQTAAFRFFGGTPAPFSLFRLYFHFPPPRAAVRTEVFATHDGQALALDFYAPQAANPGPVPCLVVIHGGGWDSGDRAQLAEWNHRWAARGYAVAAVSYRLAPRWTWPAPQEDLLAALVWLRAHADGLGIDPERLVLVGRSAGGQIATAVGYGGMAPGVTGVVAFYAPHDMPFAWSISSAEDCLNSERLMHQYFGGPPDSEDMQARYVAASGHLKVGARTPPTLLLHGQPDTLVWYRHSRRLEATLERAGVPHLLVELPWATHGFDYNLHGPGGQLADYAIERFLRAVTRPKSVIRT